MINLTHDEMNLMTIYNTGSRVGLVEELTAMRGYLEADETELRELTDSVIAKLKRMTNAEFDALDLIPDFDEIIDDGEDLRYNIVMNHQNRSGL